jgi:hypothetical protein
VLSSIGDSSTKQRMSRWISPCWVLFPRRTSQEPHGF